MIRRASWQANIVAVSVGCLGFMHSRPTWADPSATFYLETDGCGGGTTEQLRQSLSIELSAKHVGKTIADTSVRLRCENLDATMVVDDRLTEKQVKRHIDLSGSSELAWSRLLAVAIAETIRWSWAESEAMASSTVDNPAPAKAVTAPSVVMTAPSAKRDARQSNVRLDVSILRLNGAAEISGLWGAAIRATKKLGPLAFALDAQVATGQTATSRVLVDSHLLSLAAMAGPHLDARLITLDLQVGGRVGMAFFSGEATDVSVSGSSMRASWGGPLARAAATIRMLKHLRTGLAVEAGWLVEPVTGSIADEQEVRWGGGWWSIQLCVGFEL